MPPQTSPAGTKAALPQADLVTQGIPLSLPTHPTPLPTHPTLTLESENLPFPARPQVSHSRVPDNWLF